MSRRSTTLVLLVIIVAGGALTASILLYEARIAPPKQPGTFLIVANVNGFNDSVDHGVPQNSWPVITIQKGSTITIQVYNADRQPHGFQVSHYLDSPIETVAPGQTFTLTFVADQTGNFRIYCSIFCTVHAFMQSGELIVR